MRQELIDMLLEFYEEAINEKNKMNTTQQEYNKAIEIIERIEEKLDMMEKRLDEVIDKINNKSSNTITTDEEYLSSTMYGVDNKQ